MKIPKVWFQRWHMYPEDRRLGFIIDLRNREKYPTIDLCWWWGWVMIHFTDRRD